MRVVILSNGEWRNPRAFKQLLKKTDFIVACDGAYHKAKENGIKAHVVIGDLDSLSRIEIDSRVELRAYPAEKNETDTELALQYVLARKPGEILWYGAFGDRWDHTLANLFLLEQVARKKISLHLVLGGWHLYLVAKSCRITGSRGERVSLIPLSEKVQGVRTTGLKYPLHGETLCRSRTRGISNVLTTAMATIQRKQGWLLVLHERNRDRMGENKKDL